LAQGCLLAPNMTIVIPTERSDEGSFVRCWQQSRVGIDPSPAFAIGPMNDIIFSVRTTRCRSDTRSLNLKIMSPINGP